MEETPFKEIRVSINKQELEELETMADDNLLSIRDMKQRRRLGGLGER